MLDRGVARIFQRGDHTVSSIIVMAFSPRNIVGCFLNPIQTGLFFASQDRGGGAPEALPL